MDNNASAHYSPTHIIKQQKIKKQIIVSFFKSFYSFFTSNPSLFYLASCDLSKETKIVYKLLVIWPYWAFED